MKAVVKTKEGAGNIIYTNFPKPEPTPGTVLIKVGAAGICGTDLKIREGNYWSNPPVVLGHEFSGIVEAVGEGVTGFKKGDRVISETAGIVCGKCEYCLSGNYLMCGERLSIGYGTNGAMAEYITVREAIVHHIPDGISLNEAALCEPSAVSYHAVFDYAEIRPTHTVLIMGPGTIGQLVAQIVRSTGARTILCGTARDAYRLDLAASLGIETVVSDKVDLYAYIAEKIDDGHVDYAFDCSGAAPAVSQALQCLKKKGTLVQVGLTKENIRINYGLIPMKEISVKGAFGHVSSSWIGVLKMMKNGQLNVKPLITNHFSLQEWKKGFDQAQDLNCIKVLLHP